MRLDPDAWVLDEPGDWNMWRRTAATGAQILHVPTPVVVHFKERTMIEADPRLQEHQLTDAVAISAREQRRRRALHAGARPARDPGSRARAHDRLSAAEPAGLRALGRQRATA